MLGDTRSGRQLLADTAADYAEAERIVPLKSSAAGRAILDRIAERLERLVDAMESPSAVAMLVDFLPARVTSATSASNTANWSRPAESLGGQAGARTAFHAWEAYSKRAATLDTFGGSIGSGGVDKEHGSLRHPAEAAGSARFSSYSAACANAEVDDQGSASTRFLSYAAACASTEVYDYGSTSASVPSHPAAGASAEVYCYDSTLTPIDSRSQKQGVPSHIDQEIQIHLAGNSWWFQSGLHPDTGAAGSSSDSIAYPDNQVQAGEHANPAL